MNSDNRPTMAEFFAWRHHPFADTHPLMSAFLSQKDARIKERALSLLSCGKSFALCGPSGIGKSALIAHLIASLDTTVYKPILIHYAGFNRCGLLRAIADRLGLETNSRSMPLLIRLQRHLLQLTGSTNSLYPVIFVDDAQLLESESMMDLCALMISADKKTVAASLVLTGDDTLRRRLQLAAMAPVRTRLTAVFKMEPLSDKESERFILHRLELAKVKKDLFEPEAVTLIAACCRGNRRQIMNTATLLLDEVYFRQENTVNAQTLLECELLQSDEPN